MDCTARGWRGQAIGLSYPWHMETQVQTIRVLHCNSHDEGWTADSPDLQGWNTTASSYGESKTRAVEAILATLGDGAAEPKISHHIACSR
jgi:predicted RNase H-like HicB family nuclease